MDELEENFQKVGPKQNYFKDWHEQTFKSNDRVYTVKICKVNDRTKFSNDWPGDAFWIWMHPRRFLGALLKPSLCPWSGARDGRKSFPAAGEDRYSFSFIFSFSSILLNNSQIFTILIKLP